MEKKQMFLLDLKLSQKKIVPVLLQWNFKMKDQDNRISLELLIMT